MSVASLSRRLGNELYKTAFPAYRILYRAFKSYSDRTERALLRRYIIPGSIVVDAGANIGIYSQFLSNCVGPGGTVHSFEPSPDNFRRLSGVLRTFGNVRLNQLAVSDETGQSTLYVSPNLNVDHRSYPTADESRVPIATRSIRLDDYFKPGERVGLIKMDIQGYELHALRGARRLLVDNPDIGLLLEFWPFGLEQAGEKWPDLISFLEERHNHILHLKPGGLHPFRPEEVENTPDWYINLFATPRSLA